MKGRPTPMKLLIVEDQEPSLEGLEKTVAKVCLKYFPKLSVEIARCYHDAKEKISRGEYGIILLDHRMPKEDVGNLEQVNYDKFCASLENIGYLLIPYIREKCPQAVIIGTSSASPEELKGMPAPDYTTRKSGFFFVGGKIYHQVELDLEKILAEKSKK